MQQKHFTILMWVLTVLVCGIATTAWVQQNIGSGTITLYDVFPLLGLLAFSLMWMHYIGGSLKRRLGFAADTKILGRYFSITSGLVLGLILLHPGLFYYQLWADGLGLPPGSYLEIYGQPGLRIAILLGTLSLGAFLVFELKRKFSRATWWKYIEYLNVAAMFAILYHWLALGGELGEGWFRGLWIVYGAVLLAAISYNYIYDKQERQKHEQ
jgi:hypothetical protein